MCILEYFIIIFPYFSILFSRNYSAQFTSGFFVVPLSGLVALHCESDVVVYKNNAKIKWKNRQKILL